MVHRLLLSNRRILQQHSKKKNIKDGIGYDLDLNIFNINFVFYDQSDSMV